MVLAIYFTIQNYIIRLVRLIWHMQGGDSDVYIEDRGVILPIFTCPKIHLSMDLLSAGILQMAAGDVQYRENL